MTAHCTFGDRLRAARQAAGMSQAQLGALVGVTKASVSKWERDANQLSFPTLAALSELFNISLDCLVLGKNFAEWLDHVPPPPDARRIYREALGAAREKYMQQLATRGED